MPTKFEHVAPELAVEVGDQKVYRTYRKGEFECPYQYCFTTSLDEDDDSAVFDVRTLPGWNAVVTHDQIKANFPVESKNFHWIDEQIDKAILIFIEESIKKGPFFSRPKDDRKALVVEIQENVIKNVSQCDSGWQAERLFHELAAEQTDLTPAEVEEQLDDGYVEVGDGSICLHWLQPKD